MQGRVAPRAGAWIETAVSAPASTPFVVAPRAGAWIETQAILDKYKEIKSHPVRVRGLKPLLRELL